MDHHNDSGDDHHNDEQLMLASACFLSIIAIITSIANGVLLVILIIDPIKQLRTPPMYLITNLTIADILTGLLSDTLYATFYISSYLERPKELSRILGDYASCVFVSIAMWTRVALVCERFLCIKKPFRYLALANVRNMAMVVGLIWLYSTTFATVIHPFTGGTHTLIEIYINYSLPTAIIAILFCRIYAFLRKRRHNDILRFQPWQKESRKKELLVKAKRDRKMLNTVIVILTVLCISYTPYAIVAHVTYIHPQHDSLPYDIINRFARPLVFMNSGINPFIYAWRHNVFRVSIKRLFLSRNRSVVKATSSVVFPRQREEESTPPA